MFAENHQISDYRVRKPLLYSFFHAITSNDRTFGCLIIYMDTIRLSNHLHEHYSQYYFVHGNLNNILYNKTPSLMGTQYLTIVTSNEE